MKFSFSTIASRLCAVCLVFLGYSCEDNSEYMYGTPTGSCEVKGSVTDELDNPIPDAEIRLAPPFENSDAVSIASTSTNKKGNYIIEDGNSFWNLPGFLKAVCLPKDPSLKADSTIVDFHYVKSKKDKKNPWYIGHAEATVNFKLKPVDEDDPSPYEDSEDGIE